MNKQDEKLYLRGMSEEYNKIVQLIVQYEEEKSKIDRNITNCIMKLLELKGFKEGDYFRFTTDMPWNATKQLILRNYSDSEDQRIPYYREVTKSGKPDQRKYGIVHRLDYLPIIHDMYHVEFNKKGQLNV